MQIWGSQLLAICSKVGPVTIEDIIKQLETKATKLGFGQDSGDAAQEAAMLALESNYALKGQLLLEAASLSLDLLRNRRSQDMRRGASLPSDSSSKEPRVDGANEAHASLLPTRRRQSRKTRSPKGVVAYRSGGTAQMVSTAPTSGSTTGTKELRAAAAALLEIWLPRIAGGEPCTPDVQRLIRELHLALSLTPPGFLWAHFLMEAVEEALLQQFASTQPAEPVDGREVSEITGTNKRGKQATAEVSFRDYRTVPGRAMRVITTTAENQEPFKATLTFSTEPPFNYLVDQMVEPNKILQVARTQLSLIGFPEPIAPYADDPVLINWLLFRMGFEGGGGPDKLKKGTLVRLLCEPDSLANEIRAYGKRRAERATDEEAASIEREMNALAARVQAAVDNDKSQP